MTGKTPQELSAELRVPWEKMDGAAARKINAILRQRKEAADLLDRQAAIIEAKDRALEPFANFAADNTEPDPAAPTYGVWAGARCERERIVDWFGPTCFRAASEARSLTVDSSAKTENQNAQR